MNHMSHMICKNLFLFSFHIWHFQHSHVDLIRMHDNFVRHFHRHRISHSSHCMPTLSQIYHDWKLFCCHRMYENSVYYVLCSHIKDLFRMHPGHFNSFRRIWPEGGETRPSSPDSEMNKLTKTCLNSVALFHTVPNWFINGMPNWFVVNGTSFVKTLI